MTRQPDVPTFEPIPDPAPQWSQPHFVDEDERILWVGKPLLRSAVSQATGLLVFVLFLLIIPGFRPEGGIASAFTIGLVAFFGLFAVGMPMWALSRMVFVITDQAAYTRSGIFGEKVNQTSYEKITDISYNQDVLGRILGYGSININTAGSATQALTMQGLSDPLAVKRLLERAKADRLGGRARPEGGLPVFVPKDQVAQIRCPACDLVFKRPRRELGGPGTCTHCGHEFGLTEASQSG